MDKDLLNIIEKSIFAPSGENCQPWKFKIIGLKIFIYNVPEKDQSIYNFQQKGSYVAHGALLENILICAKHYGYNTSFSLFPDNKDQNLVSVVNFEKSTVNEETLFNFIEKRCTNRKSYKAEKLSKEQNDVLSKSSADVGVGQVKFIDDEIIMGEIADAMSINERLIFENKNMHSFFFNHISWTIEEDNKKGSGFYIKTLELLPKQANALKILKSWIVLRLLNKIGVSKMIAKDNAKRYRESGSFGAILIDGSSNTDFVIAGRIMQRLWLKATEMGLSLQPCTGVLFFMQNIFNGEWEDKFSSDQAEMIKNAYNKISNHYGARGKTIPMMFRIGYGDEPTARSSRMKPEIIN